MIIQEVACMKRKHVLIVSYLLFLFSVFLPWFTYNPKVMGYCWGFQFFYLWLVPVIIIGSYVFWRSTAAIFVLSELSLIVILGSYIVAFGRWQEMCNIITGFQWKDGLHTATVGFWLSFGLFWLLAVLLQIDRKKANR